MIAYDWKKIEAYEVLINTHYLLFTIYWRIKIIIVLT